MKRRSLFWVFTSLYCLAAQSSYAAPLSCEAEWHAANLTNYESHPAPDSEECLEYNGCTWAGQFYGLDGVYDEEWVSAHNIVAVHEDHWKLFGMKTLRLRQNDRTIIVQAIDACADTDCEGCCTANLGGDGFLIDIEKYTMARFGSGEGLVDFQVCETPR